MPKNVGKGKDKGVVVVVGIGVGSLGVGGRSRIVGVDVRRTA
jgi:hypothetical protein